jgi:hypothetical protein
VTDGDCALSWTNTSTTNRTGNINCDEDGGDVHQIGVDFNVTMPTAGPVVLYVTGVGSAFKVYFLVQETADNIYVGPGSIANGAGNCTTPDFTTDDSAQGFDDQEAIDAALQSIDDDGDTVVLCEHRYEYTDDIREYDGDDLYDGTLTIENETGVDANTGETKTKKRKIYDTTILKAKEMCDTFKGFNLSGDPELEEARASLEKALSGVDADTIRDSDAVRVAVKEDVDSILSKFGQFSCV